MSGATSNHRLEHQSRNLNVLVFIEQRRKTAKAAVSCTVDFPPSDSSCRQKATGSPGFHGGQTILQMQGIPEGRLQALRIGQTY
ncbi:hypothetical protein AVEN_123689-1 [Araneus ventricosus]|uniref:Uncharacterized protein n=1 Tax=Araneus ventricosus TaxID=182803 RepID=A0A4Y2HGN3_ARAVE|nr:hypothetical protein AVEN_123689-1 [Araneus ventricosus]